MIAYKAPKSTFLSDAPTIEDKIRDGVKEKLGIDIKVGSSTPFAFLHQPP